MIDPRARQLIEQTRQERDIARQRRQSGWNRNAFVGASGGHALVASPVGAPGDLAGLATMKVDAAGPNGTKLEINCCAP